jgi:transposase
MKKAAKAKDWSESEKRLLAKLVRQGISARDISTTIGRHIGSVRRMAREMRLVTKKHRTGAN